MFGIKYSVHDLICDMISHLTLCNSKW